MERVAASLLGFPTAVLEGVAASLLGFPTQSHIIYLVVEKHGRLQLAIEWASEATNALLGWWPR